MKPILYAATLLCGLTTAAHAQTTQRFYPLPFGQGNYYSPAPDGGTTYIRPSPFGGYILTQPDNTVYWTAPTQQPPLPYGYHYYPPIGQ